MTMLYKQSPQFPFTEISNQIHITVHESLPSLLISGKQERLLKTHKGIVSVLWFSCTYRKKKSVNGQVWTFLLCISALLVVLVQT